MKLARAVKVNRKPELIYPDHFPALIEFTNLPKKIKIKHSKITRWNLAREGGWDMYNQLTDKYSDKLEKIVENEYLSIQDIMKEFSSILDKIKYKAFGKVTLSNKNKIENPMFELLFKIDFRSILL